MGRAGAAVGPKTIGAGPGLAARRPQRGHRFMAIRDIDTSLITRTVKQLCLEATTVLNPDVIAAFEKGLAQEVSPQGKEIFRQLADNARIAREESISLCQDAGMAVVFIEIGQ